MERKSAVSVKKSISIDRPHASFLGFPLINPVSFCDTGQRF